MKSLVFALSVVIFFSSGVASAQDFVDESSPQGAAGRLPKITFVDSETTILISEKVNSAILADFHVRKDGLYWFDLSGPGEVELAGSLAIGSPAGAEPDLHMRIPAALTQREVGPLLLSADRIYRLATTGPDALSVTLHADELFDHPPLVPTKGTVLGPGSHLFQLGADLRVKLDGATGPRKVEVFGENGQDFAAFVANQRIPPGGYYPWVSDKPAELRVGIPKSDGPPPLVLVRVTDFASPIEEAEPNDTQPNDFDVTGVTRGVLLPVGDLDLFRFELKAAGEIAFSVEGEAMSPEFSVALYREEGGKRVDLWGRTSQFGAIRKEPLHLDDGDYVVSLKRDDKRPEPAPYALRFDPADAPVEGYEVEPNDFTSNPTPLPETLAIRGSAGADDTDMYSFSVPDNADGHLWRVFASGANRLRVHNHSGTPVLDVRAARDRIVLDSLALVPGTYLVQVDAEGEYRLGVRDLGERPEGVEGEPNDNRLTSERLLFGDEVTGSFHHAGDVDIYMFNLDAPSEVEIEITPPAEGSGLARLFQGNRKWGGDIQFGDGPAPYIYRARLPAGEWSVQMAARESAGWSGYRVGLRRVPLVADQEPNDTPLAAVKLPLNGDISGRVGGFDAVDQIMVPLPEGEGVMAATCLREADIGRWSVWDWRIKAGEVGGNRLMNAENDMIVLAYGPELGGALRLQMEGGENDQSFECSVRFAPRDFPQAQGGGSVQDNELDLTPDNSVDVPLGDGAQRTIRLALAEDVVGAVGCSDSGQPLTLDHPAWQVRGAKVYRQTSLGGLYLYKAETAPEIRVRKNGLSSESRNLTCTLMSLEGLPRPSEMGQMAEFRPIDEVEKPNAASEVSPPPPGLMELFARDQPETQPRGSLPVSIEWAEVPLLAAYANIGQSFATTAVLTNAGSEPLELALTASATNEGWRVSVEPKQFTLVPEGVSEARLHVVAPPWLSPVTAPHLVLHGASKTDFFASMAAVTVEFNSFPIGSVTYWDAPDALRGGLNVLHFGLGARMAQAGGKDVSPKNQDQVAAVHDGIAPHKVATKIEREVTFKLAAPSVLAGAMIQLRSDTDIDNWPAEVIVSVSEDGRDWQLAGGDTLSTVHRPQYIVFDRPIQAAFVRFGFPSCQRACVQAEVQEVQAIAVPGMHPPDLDPINIADPALGGHVIYALPGFGKDWNSEILVAGDRRPVVSGKDKSAAQDVVVGFHQNRAALVRSIAWTAHDTDRREAGRVRVSISTEGPSGPWKDMGDLLSPTASEFPKSEIHFEAPFWARYVRLEFPGSENGKVLLPDAIEIIEEAGTSVLALWEDDLPVGAYEASRSLEPGASAAPAGGATKEAAIELPLQEVVSSSVLIERNEDWWKVAVPEGPVQLLTLAFRGPPIKVAAVVEDGAARDAVLMPVPGKEAALQAVLPPGKHFVKIYEPPRSVVIAWDTSGSVAHYIPRTLAAVRTWASSLKPGRDALNLLPFGDAMLFSDFAETEESVLPFIRDLSGTDSSEAERAMADASTALVDREGAKGIVILTDAETPFYDGLWPALLRSNPRVVALSIDSDSRRNAEILMDWTASNGGRFLRVMGPLGLADGMDMAAAIFRNPKQYEMVATLEEYVEPEGEATIVIKAATEVPNGARTGAVELILDASGSMLQKLNGRPRIDVAHDALTGLVEEVLPEGTPFAFRAFGLEKDACLSELRVPLGPLNRSGASKAIRKVPAINLAKTAIADSLLAAGQDMRNAAEPRVIVLVTDGEETCDGDPEAAIEELRATGLDIQLNIVGFAIAEDVLAATFEKWASKGGGSYFRADTPEELESSIRAAISPRFEIVRTYLDGSSKSIGFIGLDQPIVVPAGELTIRPTGSATGGTVTRQVFPGEEILMKYSAKQGLSVP